MKMKFKVVLFSLVIAGGNTITWGQTNIDTTAFRARDSRGKMIDNQQMVNGGDSLASLKLAAEDSLKKFQVQNVPDTSIPVDGFYNNTLLATAKPFPYPKVNMINVRFFKRIWRDIDLKDSANAIFTNPGSSLMEVIVDGINNGKITAYDPSATKKNPTGDAFTTRLTPAQAMQRLNDSVLVKLFDSAGNETGSQMVLNDFDPTKVTKFRIKEDIFFDKQRSRIETRIIGLAPVINVNAAGETVSQQPAFWLYFPQCRYLFATKEVADPKKEIYDVSFDDIFIQHNFKSQIVKESNPGQLSIKDYAKDNETQEANRIEQQIIEYKKRVWKY